MYYREIVLRQEKQKPAKLTLIFLSWGSKTHFNIVENLEIIFIEKRIVIYEIVEIKAVFHKYQTGIYVFRGTRFVCFKVLTRILMF